MPLASKKGGAQLTAGPWHWHSSLEETGDGHCIAAKWQAGPECSAAPDASGGQKRGRPRGGPHMSRACCRPAGARATACCTDYTARAAPGNRGSSSAQGWRAPGQATCSAYTHAARSTQHTARYSLCGHGQCMIRAQGSACRANGPKGGGNGRCSGSTRRGSQRGRACFACYA